MSSCGNKFSMQKNPTCRIILTWRRETRTRARTLLFWLVLSGEYGIGSSRDGAAKGPMLLGVKAVIAKSFEQIHRGNLVGMGIIPFCFKPGEDAETLGLDGHEIYTIDLPNRASELKPGQDVKVVTDNSKSFTCTVRFDTEVELAYFDHGGILQCHPDLSQGSAQRVIAPMLWKLEI